MWGPDTEEQAVEGTLGSYHEFESQDEKVMPQDETGWADEEAGQELLLPTVTRYGLIRRYKSKIRRKKREKRVEDTLFGHAMGSYGENNKYSKGDSTRMKQNIEKFFRNATTFEASSIKEADNYQMVTLIHEMVDQEFPSNTEQIPFGQDLIHVGEVKENRGRYAPGDWVEVEGNDMKWRLDMITRAIKQAPDDWDWNDPQNEDKEPRWTFVYNAGNSRNIKEEDLRSPEAGLKHVFGCRPWVWQQWAILKIEDKLRFQEGHQDDFATLDIQKLAVDLWEQWLNHPANIEFQEVFYDDRIGERGRLELVNHIQKPFQLIDAMGEENKEWDFSNDDDINVFTYVSLLGSGLTIPFLVMSVQIAIPALLIMDAKDSCFNGEDLNPDWYLTKIMSIVVFVYYMYSIIPDTYVTFYNVNGAADSVFSRLLSLRRMVWTQGDDNYVEMVGFKLDIFMNTAYQAILMKDVIEVVLNALAFIFIDRIDEDLAKSGWYDPDKRWLTAGAIETAMQATIQLRVLSSPKLFSERFEIHEELLLTVCDGDQSLLCNHRIAGIDATDPAFMTMEERIQLLCGKVAEDSNNKNAMEEYKKNPVYFGLLESSFLSFCGGYFSYSHPMFERFNAWRTWSRWDKVLFMSPVPTLDDIFEDNAGEGITLPAVNNQIPQPLPNFYPHESSSNIRNFIRHYFRVLFFLDLLPNLRPVCSLSRIPSFLFRLFDGLIWNWLSYFTMLVFPLYLLSALAEVIYNVAYLKCFSPTEYVWRLFIGYVAE